MTPSERKKRLYHEIKKKEDRLFERLNSKYNRLWQQETSIGILMTEIVVGFLFASLTLDFFNKLTSSLLPYITIAILGLLIVLSFGIGKLEFERTETKKWLSIFIVR